MNKPLVRIIILIILAFLLLNCNSNNKSEKELEIKKRELDLKQKELDIKEREFRFDSIQKSKEINISDNISSNNSVKTDEKSKQIIKNKTVTDIDGNKYKTITVGTQIWMAENLRTTRFNDGALITLETDNDTWSVLKTPSYCNNKNTTSEDFIIKYGCLYNWYTVSINKLCPNGWHVPSDNEWTILTNYLGGENIAGSKLKKTGTSYWDSRNIDATDEVGFSALPGGFRGFSGVFHDSNGVITAWWCSTEEKETYAYARYIFSYFGLVVSFTSDKRCGLSVRCVKD